MNTKQSNDTEWEKLEAEGRRVKAWRKKYLKKVGEPSRSGSGTVAQKVRKDKKEK